MGRTGINWGAEFPQFTVDLTGDGKTDILGFGTDGVWVSLNDGKGNFSTPSFIPNDSSGQGQFGYGQEWRIEKHVRTVGEIAATLRAKIGNAVNTLNFRTASASSGGAAPTATPAGAEGALGRSRPVGGATTHQLAASPSQRL